ncbi:C-type lectin 37Db [Drosophila biarmipes]|uniref:C-type lectin 37Db n=1 Tax=Drosophila biarmipes TaxID=125945 RepID=UPI0007E69C94|nr:C-type lectin 37Db [Drosophila biarmipes]
MVKYGAVPILVLLAAGHYGSLAESENGEFQNPWDNLTDLLGRIPLRMATPQPNFQLIGSRYFHIEQNIKQNWTTAASTCRQLGGYLAAMKDEEEAKAIIARLTPFKYYYMGINDHEKRRSFVSLASGKPAFLKWSKGEPDYVYHDQNCVSILNFNPDDEGLMVAPCSNKYTFICQKDTEI